MRDQRLFKGHLTTTDSAKTPLRRFWEADLDMGHVRPVFLHKYHLVKGFHLDFGSSVGVYWTPESFNS
jgi:hypothetical protein